MDYKEKYEQALNRASGFKTPECRDVAEYIFPELKESEDWIPKEIIKYLKEKSDFRSCWIAWLEKHGEHANFRNKIQIGDKVTRNKDGVLVNLSQIKRVAKKDEKQDEQPKKRDVCDNCDQQGSCVSPCPMKLIEKQGEQNPTDKSEPKLTDGFGQSKLRLSITQIQAIEKYVKKYVEFVNS